MLPLAILAGGLATRLRPHTEKVPKSLLEVNGEPFIIHQLRLLRAHGMQQVVLCVGYLGEMIREVVSDGHAYGLEVDYSFDGDALKGTAGALKQALPKLSDSFLTLYGDSYLCCDYSKVAEEFSASGKQALMTVFRNEGKWDASNVEFEHGEILAYDKNARTPRMKFIDYGLGAFQAKALDFVEAGQTCDLAELYRRMLTEKQLAGIEIQQRFYEIGSREGLEETARFIAAQGVKRA